MMRLVEEHKKQMLPLFLASRPASLEKKENVSHE